MKRKPENIEASDWEAVESPPLSDDLLNRMRPVRDSHPDRPHRVAGPQKMSTKVLLSIQFTPEVVNYFKATGPGWQSRMDEALKDWIEAHPLP
jgi:uncharacterized protein (DUF4415 family)